MTFTLKQEPEDFVVEEIPKPWIINDIKGPYTYFKLQKRDFTTEEAVRRIAQKVRRPRKLFGYAGTKDRRAMTTQYCSVKGSFRTLEMDGISAEPIGAGTEPISLGDLLANRFTIKVRDAKKEPTRLNYVPNYFDEQRFGSKGDNHIIGEAILRNDFQKAAQLAIQQSIRFAEKAREHLEKNPNEHVGALRLLPKKTLLFYLHSYQSMLFNELLDGIIRVSTGDISEIKIQPFGTFAVPKEVLLNMLSIELPIIGFGTAFEDVEDNIIRKLAAKSISSRNLTPRSFIIRQIPELSAEGKMRSAFVALDGLVVKKEKDGFLVSFSLPPGSYATAAIKAMFA